LHSFPHCLLIVHQCTRTHPPPSSELAWPLVPALFAHGVPMYPHTLAASSCLVWPLVPALFAHSAPLHTLAASSCLAWPLVLFSAQLAPVFPGNHRHSSQLTTSKVLKLSNPGNECEVLAGGEGEGGRIDRCGPGWADGGPRCARDPRWA